MKRVKRLNVHFLSGLPADGEVISGKKLWEISLSVEKRFHDFLFSSFGKRRNDAMHVNYCELQVLYVTVLFNKRS